MRCRPQARTDAAPSPCRCLYRAYKGTNFLWRRPGLLHHGWRLDPHAAPEGLEQPEDFYATELHELTHWTRHPARLNRDFGRKAWGDDAYAPEELVAELASAFLCAELEITPDIREDHAAYIQSWLKALKNDKRFLFQAAAQAYRTVDYLQELQPHTPP